MAEQICKSCGQTWPASFFYANQNGTCMGCRPNRRTLGAKLRHKVTNSIIRHAVSLNIPRSDLVSSFGWNASRMVDDLTHAAAGKCPYCQKPIDDPLAYTFDILDPQKPPHYASNVRICCLECNISKNKMSPEAWAERIDCWNKYREYLERLKSNPVINLPLFKGL